MSLPTPPGTSHREEKENRAPRFSRVSWCETAEYHPITSSPPRTLSARSTVSRAGPSRSILKKPVYPTTLRADENAKEGTPEPSDPLTDLHYLDGPVSRILAPDASLRDLIEAYFVLTARLRACVTENTDADASWPLFQPLRKQRDLFVEAMVRDIRHVFVDPVEEAASSTDSIESPRGEPSTLPSPRDSPKKKHGMSEEQVKRARDLCGVCQAVLKLLILVSTVPALYQLFTDDELGYILTQVLAIPLANELPTPNARKTCSLAIWLIQAQRLPAEVLEPAKDRIAYALRRGIEGELGKEGKKGSIGDGLKAVHDLSLYQPAIFVPTFAPLLPAILSNLLAPTLPIRTQACHALGGFALAVASLPPSEVHTRISTAVAARLVKQVDVSGPMSPAKRGALASPSKDSLLVRTLRTTLQGLEPKHAAQGPVWAFTVLAHLIVLLGPTVYLHGELTRVVMALFSLGMRHPKSSVRGLGCLAWRAMTWAYFRPPHVKLTITTDTDDEAEDSATEDDLMEERRKHDDALRASFKYFAGVVDMGAGVGSVGALLGQEITEEIHVRGALRILRAMSKKGGHTCKDAMDIARHLLGVVASRQQHLEPEWDHHKLLAPGLFSTNPGLLTTEWKVLSTVVKGLLEQCPQISDIRMLTYEEIGMDGMWDEFLAVWKDGLAVLRLQWGSEEIPTEIREIWFNLLKSHAGPLLDADDHQGLVELAARTRDVLVEVLEDDSFDFTLSKEDFGEHVPTSPIKPTSTRTKNKAAKKPLPESRWNYAVKLFLVRDLFTIAHAVFPDDVFASLAESIAKFLNTNEALLVGDVQCSDEVREQWASICADATLACDISVLQAFWANTLGKPSNGHRNSEWCVDVRAAVWQVFVDRWEDSKSWEAAIVLLSVPFIETSGWELASEDLIAWEAFLKRSIDAALDCGVDAPALIDHIAGAIAAGQAPGEASSVRVADLLLSNFEVAEAREVPSELLDFTSDTLHAAYPPAPRHKVMCMWLIRSLTRVIDACPHELCFSALQLLLEGLCTWIADDFDVCTADEYSSDILPLYQTVLVSFQALEKNAYHLEALAPILEAPFRGRQDKHAGVVEAFSDFWQETFASMPEPSSGWPEQIVRCLEAVAREQEDEASVENLTALDEDCASPCYEPTAQQEVATGEDSEKSFDSDDEGSVELPSPGTLSRLSAAPLLRPAVFPRFSSPEPSLPLAPSTPKSSPRTQRPHASLRSVRSIEDAMFVNASPASSPIRAPTTPKRSPAKADGTGSARSQASRNKENMSPSLRIATVTERLAMRSPLLLESILGKRPRGDEFEDADLAEKVYKKGRLDASLLAPPPAFSNASTSERPAPSASTDDKPVFEEDESSSSASDSEEIIQPVASGSRKRKGSFLDAVVVPSVAEVLRAKRRFSADLRGTSLSLDSGTPASEPKSPALRRTRSATKLLGKEAEFQRLPYTPKKRRMGRAHQLREEAASEPMSSPSRSLQDAQLFGSDDSIMLASPSKLCELPPSDDEPHLAIGQVTPHRLVSPAIRRVQHVDFNSDPPSDDSNMSNSPSSQRVVRKMARLGSESEQPSRLTPLNLRARSASEFSSFSAHGSDL
ncbi:uncharacterized protein TRAVEDRAFT_166567 [Trametes versicolor FP-101664 SS1]|uniref:uncharacterized protein n=1 Tax=Trametes versicolor (strain FP-101664) TaxID=717944 RepID=UPI0004621990|nr:uncharacterized protein TRAVEDRAFT_166567 [Trametes versicolor FP-101664 SS1]EIW59256.1 hypothetical protein TRAVEDRAFT_166567 [Trametes versicolor FP-101664 SS1]